MLVSSCALSSTMIEVNNAVIIEADGDSASIHPVGATVISWKSGKERLFLSSKAILDGKTPIRGGVPVIFPQFANGTFMKAKHGFARNQIWSVEKVADNQVICKLRHNEDTLSQWPYQFELILTVSISKNNLDFDFAVKNVELEKPIEFTCLLHTYFSVDAIENVGVQGFKSLTYIDKTEGNGEAIESRDIATVDKEVDRIYKDCPSGVLLSESGDSMVKIHKTHLSDMVLWNPWAKLAAELKDFDDQEYHRMVCIEAGQVTKSVILPAGQTWSSQMRLQTNPYN